MTSVAFSLRATRIAKHSCVNSLRGPGLGGLIITHYQRLLDYIVPDRVHVLMGGRIVQSGGPELAQQLEASGYGSVQAA